MAFRASLFVVVLAGVISTGAARVASQSPPEYTIEAIRFGTIPQFRVASLVSGADAAERLDIATVVWLIRGGGRNILFDSGYYRSTPGFDRFKTTDYVRPDEAVALAGVGAAEVTDIVISHVHWDHMGGIDLFPAATIWIQREEDQYDMGRSWQPGETRGADVEDLVTLLKRNAAGQVRMIDGDDREFVSGIRAYTGARHTFASQYLRVAGTPAFVLASDNCYLYRNLDTKAAIAQTFAASDRAANVAAFDRMIALAGAPERVIPGHDPLQFETLPFKGPGRENQVMKTLLVLGVLASVPLVPMTQLTSTNAAGMSMGHVHLNVKDPEIQKRLWVQHFGASSIAAEGVSGVKLPGMLILFEQRASMGGSQGTVMDHFGLKVRDLASTLAEWRAAGYQVQREFKGTEGFPNAYLMGPDQVRIELQEDTTLPARAIAYHLHYFLDSPGKLRDWYVQTLAMETGKRGDHETANLPGFNLSFTPSKTALVGAKTRSVDHVGFEVRNLEAFCKKLEASGVKFDVPYRRERGFASAFLSDPYGVSIELTEGLDKF